jgi:B-box zinc finger
MNCATHNDIAAVAYCRTCGKPLCANCKRDVKGVIYCENCLAERLQGVQPSPSAYQPVVDPSVKAALPGSGPNPALAGILAAFFPFGVGAVYTGQYAKGLGHLVTFALLVVAASSVHGGLEPLFGLGIAFFYFYQIIDAVRSAKAIQLGQPAPDPFGLGQAFSTGEKFDTARVPTASIVLIVLGVLFLMHTIGNLEFGFEWILPSFLILWGSWLFARRLGLLDSTSAERNVEGRSSQSFVGPTILVTLGGLWFVHNLHRLGFIAAVGVLLVVIGLVKILQGNAPVSDSAGGLPPLQSGTNPTGMITGEAPPPPSEVNRG